MIIDTSHALTTAFWFLMPIQYPPCWEGMLGFYTRRVGISSYASAGSIVHVKVRAEFLHMLSTGSMVHVKEKGSVRAIEAHYNYYVLEKVAPASLE
ncbi:hypothetical protein OIU85_023633 [Salix viminalis]|uniref:Uncharacterized protein n=1 Tax=Salix viminalis TaxID=40686 RepID=A0A9Q0TZ28_SALVM|nr:hypothetical protein OIU85_023633 [Salix viminalis]